MTKENIQQINELKDMITTHCEEQQLSKLSEKIDDKEKRKA